jgi:hypothetical protein
MLPTKHLGLRLKVIAPAWVVIWRHPCQKKKTSLLEKASLDLKMSGLEELILLDLGPGPMNYHGSILTGKVENQAKETVPTSTGKLTSG